MDVEAVLANETNTRCHQRQAAEVLTLGKDAQSDDLKTSSRKLAGHGNTIAEAPIEDARVETALAEAELIFLD